MKPIDLSKISTNYTKGWIALTPDDRKFVASGNTLEEVLAKAGKKGISNPSVLKAVPVKNLYIGSIVTFMYPQQIVIKTLLS